MIDHRGQTSLAHFAIWQGLGMNLAWTWNFHIIYGSLGAFGRFWGHLGSSAGHPEGVFVAIDIIPTAM